jgi:hypothetical protein
MSEPKSTADPLAAFSDAVMAIISNARVISIPAPRIGFACICRALLPNLTLEAPGARV